MFVQRCDGSAEIRVRLRVLLLETSRDRAHLSLSLGYCHAGLESRHDLEIVTVSICSLLGSERNRHPCLIVTGRKLKPRRHYTYNDVTFAIQCQRLANDAWIAAEPALPQCVTQQNHTLSARLIFHRRK